MVQLHPMTTCKLHPCLQVVSSILRFLSLSLALFLSCSLSAVWDRGVSFQGRVLSNGVAFNGLGEFKFAIIEEGVNGQITTIWSHDASSQNGLAPETSIKLLVDQGHYNLLLGDSTAMAGFPDNVFSTINPKLRIWFNDGVNGEEQLSPDLPLTSVLFANKSKVADTVTSLPEELVELRHLNSSLQNTIQDLQARLQFLEAKSALVSQSAQDNALLIGGYVKYGSSDKLDPLVSSPTYLPSSRTFGESSSSSDFWLIWGGLSRLGRPLATGAFQNIKSGEWTSTGLLDAPAPRYGHVQISVGDFFFLHGGQGASTLLGSAHVFDPSFNQWTTLPTPDSLSPRIGHTAITTEDQKSVLLFGGRTSEGLSNRFELIDVYSQTWDSSIPVKLNNVITQRQNAKAARVGQWVVVWGGENESGPLSDGIRIDLQNDFSTTITAPGPSARTNFSMTTVDDKIYVWGGEGIEGSLSDGFAYDPTLNTWSKMGDQTDVASRQEHDAFASGSDIVFAGGNSNGQFLYNFNIYNTSTKLWREVVVGANTPNQASISFTGAVVNLVGGRLNSGQLNTQMHSIDTTPSLFFYRKP